jgi:hypothetical protein
MDKGARATALLLCAAATACSSATSTPAGALPSSDAGASPSSIDCAPSWAVLDTSRRCVEPAAIASGLCMSTTTRVKGLYLICARSPAGAWFIKNVSTDCVLSGDGWTFGPNWIADILHATRMSASDDALCGPIVQSARGALPPACSP